MRRCRRRSCDSVGVVVDGGVSWVRARRTDGRVRGGAVVVRCSEDGGPELVVVVPDGGGGGGRVSNR